MRPTAHYVLRFVCDVLDCDTDQITRKYYRYSDSTPHGRAMRLARVMYARCCSTAGMTLTEIAEAARKSRSAIKRWVTVKVDSDEEQLVQRAEAHMLRIIDHRPIYEPATMRKACRGRLTDAKTGQ